MPIYEYECKNCGMTLEELQSFSDPPLKKCPSCKKNKLEKLISLSSFQLTGTGWYATDYANGPGIPGRIKDQQDAAAEESTGDSTSSSDSTATVTETGPSSAADKFKSIEKETKKAKSEKKK
jgi:putative FmdB family regulatory protein